MNRIAFFAKSISPLFKSAPQYTKKTPYAAISSSYKKYCAFTEYNAYIANKKEDLKNNNIPFTERLVTKNSDSYSILMYDSDTNKKYFNGQIRNEIFKRNKYYISENFSLAVAQGLHPREFSSIKAIKSQPALNTENITNYYKKISTTGHHFYFSNFFYILDGIAESVANKPYNNSQSYLLQTTSLDTCAIIMEKKDNKLWLKFYNPLSATNTYKIFILRHADDINHLVTSDFMNLLHRLSNYLKQDKVILNTETITTNKEADIEIFSSTTTNKVAKMPDTEHYKTELVQRNKDIYDINKLDLKDVIASVIYDTYLYLFNKKINFPILDYKYIHFLVTCYINDVKLIKDHIDNVLNSPYDVFDKIEFLDTEFPGCIRKSMLYNTSEAWEIFFTATLENKTISSEDKMRLFRCGFSSPILNLCLLYDESIDSHKKEKIHENLLKTFNKYIEDILNTDAFTVEEKIKLMNNIAPRSIISILFDMQLPISFLKSYADIILNNKNISDKTKVSVLDLKSDKDTKKVLYGDMNYESSAIAYVTKIITSTLSTTDKQYLLHIENDPACAHSLQQLVKRRNPEIAKLCIDIIPSYKKIV
jgi:hypothetical protein